MRFPAWTRFALNLLLTACLILVVGRAVGWQKIEGALCQAEIRLVILGWLICFVARCGEATQLSLVMCRAESAARPHHVLMASSLSAVYGVILPGDIGTSVAKWAYLSAATGSRSKALNAIVYSRLMTLLPCLISGLLALSVHNPWQTVWWWNPSSAKR